MDKRAYVALREQVDYLKRRAEEAAGASELFHLTGSKEEEIDLAMTAKEVNIEKQRRALECTVTYREMIEAHQDGSRGQAQYPAQGGV